MAYGLTKSASVNGTSQYFTYSTASGAIRVTNNFTFECWVKYTNVGTGYADMLISSWGNVTALNCAYFLYSYHNAGVYNLELDVASGASSGGAKVVWQPTNGTWYHVAVTFASGTTKFYINGTQQGTDQTMGGGITSINASNDTNTGGLACYYDGATPSSFLAGQISLVRIWSQVQSQATIAANMCTVFGTTTTGLVTEWSLDNVLTDASGNSYTLTNNGSTTFTTDTPSTCATSNPTVNVSDSITITETIKVTLTSLISKTDAITIGENSTISNSQLGGISVTDALTLGEVLSLTRFSFINVSDAISITDTLSMAFVWAISVSDSITITETVTVRTAQLGGISVTDSVVLAENQSFTGQLGSISVSDTLTLGESFSLLNIYPTLLISVTDAVTLTESITFSSISVSINVSDSITITESKTVFRLDIQSGIARLRGNEDTYPLGMDDLTLL